jgi:hypothetical protein
MLEFAELVSAAVASLWPQRYRRWRYPEAPTLLVLGTAISGTVEWIVFSWLETLQFRKHLFAQAGHFAEANEGTTVAALAVIFVAELFYPVSLLLIILAAEGFIRFVSGAILREPMPSLPVSIAVHLYDRLIGRPKSIPQL